MSRVTRSKKIEIVEDSTADTLGLESISLPHTDSQTRPLADVAGNTMTEEELLVENELKGLKAAYRIAIGDNKKGKKTKSKKKGNVQELEAVHLVESKGGLVQHDGREISQEDSLQLNTEKTVQATTKSTVTEAVDEQDPEPVQPATRTTRRQAKAKEGPYENLLADILSEQNVTTKVGRPKDVDFLMSLIAGRSAGPSRNLNNSVARSSKKSGRTANNYIFIAEEALKKSSREAMRTEDAKYQVPQNVIFEAEPKELAENPKGQKTEHPSAEPAPELTKSPTCAEAEDSFVEQITCRSPAKSVHRTRDSFEFITKASPSKSLISPVVNEESTSQTNGDDGDSFLEHISSRSPAKTYSRIEDSVEALDQMEEVEEALQEAAMTKRMVSTEKTRPILKGQPTKASASVGPKPTRDLPATKQQPGKPGYASMRVNPTVAKHTSIIKKATSMTFRASDSSDTSSIREVVDKSIPITKKGSVKRPVSLLPPKEPVKSAKAVTRPANFELPGEAIARKLKEQREARLAQRNDTSEESFHTARTTSGPSVKSTKPLTKPSFELPGEALSRKKREAHEAKLKAQEEEERKRREFRAKPVRKSVITTIRDTVASRARQSKIGIESIADRNLTVSKRASNVGAHRPSIQELHSMAANTSAPRAPAPAAPLERKPSTKFHGPSMSGLAMQRTVSASDVQVQRQRAKEIYNRDNKLVEDIERDRREREAAAKRSREEAAERGRQASREWAAKQLAKKTAEGDKGMSAGYGPGGQMGLKS